MAVQYITLDDFFTNLQFQCEISPDLSELSELIHDYAITHTSIGGLEFTEVMTNAMLGKLTGCVVATGTDLNCYPVGLVTQIFFDVDGHPV